jgi:predicted peptidase
MNSSFKYLLPVLLVLASPTLAGPQEAPSKPTEDRKEAAESRRSTYFNCSDGYRLRHTLASPDELVEGERYPLVLCLHGSGGGTQAPKALESRDGSPCFVLVPSVPSKEFSWAGRRRNGIPYVLELIDDLLERLPIDPDRLYVTGQSMGGAGTFGAVAARPDFFAAAVPVCGGWDPADAPRMKDVPMWVFHGDADTVVPVRYSREMVAALREAGGSPKYSELGGVRHNAWADAYASEAMWTWLFAQKRPDDPETTRQANPVEEEPDGEGTSTTTPSKPGRLVPG